MMIPAGVFKTRQILEVELGLQGAKARVLCLGRSAVQSTGLEIDQDELGFLRPGEEGWEVLQAWIKRHKMRLRECALVMPDIPIIQHDVYLPKTSLQLSPMALQQRVNQELELLLPEMLSQYYVCLKSQKKFSDQEIKIETQSVLKTVFETVLQGLSKLDLNCCYCGPCRLSEEADFRAVNFWPWLRRFESYRWNRLACAFGLAFFCGISPLFFTYPEALRQVHVLEDVHRQRVQASLEDQGQLKILQNLQAQLRVRQKAILVLQNFKDQILALPELLQQLSEALPMDCFLMSLELKGHQVSLSLMAPDPEHLERFIQNVKGIQAIKEVSISHLEFKAESQKELVWIELTWRVSDEGI